MKTQDDKNMQKYVDIGNDHTFSLKDLYSILYEPLDYPEIKTTVAFMQKPPGKSRFALEFVEGLFDTDRLGTYGLEATSHKELTPAQKQVNNLLRNDGARSNLLNHGLSSKQSYKLAMYFADTADQIDYMAGQFAASFACENAYDASAMLCLYTGHLESSIEKVSPTGNKYIKTSVTTRPEMAMTFLAIFAMLSPEGFAQVMESFLMRTRQNGSDYLCQDICIETDNDAENYYFGFDPKYAFDELQRLMRQYPKLLLVGDGGSGKTTLLTRFYMLLSEGATEYVFRVSLSARGLLRQEVYIEDHFRMPESSILLRWICRMEEFDSPAYLWELMNNNPITLLVDGLNELPSTPEMQESVQVIYLELSRLAALPNMRIVVTSRICGADELSRALSNISHLYTVGKLLGVLPETYVEIEADVKKHGSEALEKLLHLPMYFNLYRNMDMETRRTIDSRYTMLNSFYYFNYQRRLEKWFGAEREVFEITLSAIAPAIALRMAADNTHRFTLNQLCEAIENEIERLLLLGLYLPLQDNMPHQLPSIPSTNLCKQVLQMLTEREHILIYGEGGYGFFHQDQRDYLAALNVSRQHLILRSIWNQPVAASFDFRLAEMDDTIFEMISQAVLETSDLTLPKVEKNFVRKVTPNFSLYDLSPSNITGAIKWYAFAKDIGQDIVNRNGNTFFDTYANMIEDICVTIASCPQFAWPKKETTELLWKHAELLRRGKRYRLALTIVKIALDFDEETVTSLHHKAKIYLSCFQTLCEQQGNIISDECLLPEISADDGIESYKHQLVQKGLNLLEECAQQGSVLSGNLMGFLCTTPPPRLKPYLTIDYKRGFLAYFRSVYTKSLHENVRRSLSNTAYAIRQCVNLLLEGKIGFAKHIILLEALTDEQILPGPVAQDDPGYSYNVEIADRLLSKIERMHIGMKHYLRGHIYLYQQKYTEAYKSFEQEENEILADIFRAWLLFTCRVIDNSDSLEPLINKISASLCEMQKKADCLGGAVDQYHYSYKLEQVKKELNERCPELEAAYHLAADRY